MEFLETPGRQSPSAATSACALSDVLSELLENARLRGWVSEESSLTTPWHIQADSKAARFYVLCQGYCRFELEGGVAFVDLAPGDLVLETRGQGHSVCNSPPNQSTSGEQVVTVDKAARRRRSVSGGGGPLTTLVYGGFVFNKDTVSLLISSLPPFIHIAGAKGKAMPWLAETIGLILRESDPTQPGRQAIVDRLAQVIFIQAVRSYATTLPGECHNWLAAVMDPEIGPALGLMHSQPERPWTVALLANRVGMSRSAFASRFKNLLSKPPQQYLLDCRMRKACSLLVEEEYGVKQIAGRVGYATDAAFSNAFKRWSGKAPGTYRRVALGGTDPNNDCPDRR
jgi:AraC-like DNA-binding protein